VARFSRWNPWVLFWTGLVVFVLGSGPLLAIIVADKLGWTSDPNSNPVGFGIMAMCTFWPSLLAMVAGLVLVAIKRTRGR
jgi:hypothetical protein